MKDDWDNLADVLRRIMNLLRKHNEQFWPNKLDLLEFKASHRSPDCPDLVLKLYGGMGSFSDLYICPQNDHKIRQEDIVAVNQSLSELREQAWLLATQLKKMKAEPPP